MEITRTTFSDQIDLNTTLYMILCRRQEKKMSFGLVCVGNVAYVLDISCVFLIIVQHKKERGASGTTTSRGAESINAKKENSRRACS